MGTLSKQVVRELLNITRHKYTETVIFPEFLIFTAIIFNYSLLVKYKSFGNPEFRKSNMPAITFIKSTLLQCCHQYK